MAIFAYMGIIIFVGMTWGVIKQRISEHQYSFLTALLSITIFISTIKNLDQFFVALGSMIFTLWIKDWWDKGGRDITHEITVNTMNQIRRYRAE